VSACATLSFQRRTADTSDFSPRGHMEHEGVHVSMVEQNLGL
jgi:hypothetical protein